MRAAIYARISRDSEGESRGIDRQLADCRALAGKSGWEVVQEFPENDLSASTHSRKPRPKYEAMLDAVRAGQIDVIIAYSNSRLTRRVREYLDLIDLHRDTGVIIKTCVSGGADLGTADGRATAITLATWDAAEAERTSERLKRQKAQRAAAGKPQGGRYRVFGYTRQFAPVEAEASVVREIFQQRALGQSLTSIARELRARGLSTSAGKPWSASSVGKLISRPGYCGLREYRGEIVGKTDYPSLVEEPVWRAANSGAKSSPGTNARRWLMSGIARCGRCSAGMVGSTAKGYRCHAVHGGCGRISIKSPWLEDPIVSLVLAREAAQVPSARPPAPPVDLGALDEEIAAVRAAYRDGELARIDMIDILGDLRAKRIAGEVAMADSVTAASGPLITHAGWLGLDLSQRRALLGRHLDSVIVGPRSGKGPGRYQPERLTVRWRDGEVQKVTADALAVIPQRDSENSKWRYPPGTAKVTFGPAPGQR